MATTAAELAVVVAQIRSGHSPPALATLIAPDLAVTGYQVVNSISEVELASPLWSAAARAVVTGSDPKREFAVLRLDRAVAPVEPELLASVVPPPGSSWTSPAPPVAGFETVEGTVGDVVRVRGRQLLRVTFASENPVRQILIGAPVVVNGHVAAVVTLLENAAVYATTVESMAASARVLEVGNLLPLNEADLFRRLSQSSGEALSIAVELSRDPDRRVHMRDLLLGLYAKRDGLTRKLVDVQTLRKAVGSEIPELPQTPPVPLSAMPALSGHVRDALQAARNLARVHRSDRVRSRHLLYGALSIEKCSAIKPLIDAGLEKERIDLKTPGPTRKSGIAGYKSDALVGPDLLGIKRDVESLCMVLAAKDVEPPLSLGLFGEWGSGKSFFMRAMEDWFNALAHKPENEREDSPYCRRIVQLKFNAWHYSDTNLWATLASAILQGLAEVLAEKDDPDSHYARASLETQKVRKAAELATAEQEAAKLHADLRAADERLERLGEGRPAAAAARETLRAAAQVPALKQKLDNASAEAGITAAAGAATQLQRQLLEVRGLWDALVVIGRGARRGKMFVLSAVSIVLVLVAIALLPWAADRGLAGFLGAVTPLLAAAAAALQRVVAPARRALILVEQVRSQAESALEEERRRLQLEADKAQQNANDARSAIQSIDAQLEALRPDRRMRDFVLQRSVSPDYLAQLGTISHARRDFEQLTTLLAKVKDMAEKDALLPHIDRIILYIDDLDRCPEAKVVLVLQAVHMLLAFNLFIVVVGVDPRWLLHSLRQHSTAFQDGGNAHDESAPDAERERSHWRSTPLNYLEKIFQIPFTLRPMGIAGFNNLIDDLTKRNDSTESETSETDDEATGARQPADRKIETTASQRAASKPGTDSSPQVSMQQAQSDVQTPAQPAGAATSTSAGIRIAMDPQLLRFENFERECMKQLRDLIPSPRAAKRFVNVYRLLRNRLAEEPWSDLLDDKERGAYRPVLVLFAMLMGYPQQTSEVLHAILEGHLPGETGEVERGFWELIDELERHETSTPRIDSEAAERWKELGDKLRRVRGLVPEDCGSLDLRPYAAAVARYSFQSGRLLIDVDTSVEQG